MTDHPPPQRLRLCLLGAPRIAVDDQVSALPFERRSQLLVHLAVRRAWVPRTELAALFWPEQSERQAHANLRKTLFRLQALPWGRAIDAHGSAVRAEVDTDVQDIESALRAGRVADALPLWQGEPMAGFDDGRSEPWTGWLDLERERLRDVWRQALLEHLSRELAPAEGIEVSARLLAGDPLDETAVQLHMQWLARGAQWARARQVYNAFADRLQQELGLAPSATLQRLHATMADGSPALPRPAGRPVVDDGFIGRAAERREIARRLALDDGRLLCLVGPGGVGKTRLAQRVMADLAGAVDTDPAKNRPDVGTAFVGLEDVTSARDMAARVAHAIGQTLSGSSDPESQLVTALRGRRLLLVLDNFEQLASDAALLGRLLQGAPQLRLVVTSRVRLPVAEAWTLTIDGLPCPELEDQDRIGDFDAARLFVEAARRAGGSVDPVTDAAAIADICRQVDGLPLALELAAAWTRALSCEAIATDLRQGAELLRTADPARPARHASVDAVFDRSWQLLGPVEREVLARLTVFHGSFSVESARLVAGAALPVLGALVDKSLLRRQGQRLALHPLLHQLAASRLPAGAPRAAVERTHGQHFIRLLSRLRPGVEAGDADALRQVDDDFDNSRAAWRWAIDQGDVTGLTASALTLLHHCDHRGCFQDGLDLLQAAVPARSGAPGGALGLLLASAVAHLSYRLDRYAEATAIATRTLAATRSSRDHDARLQCHKVLGACALRQGRFADARRHFRQALQLAPASVDPRQAAAMLDNLAQVEKASGNYDEALRMATQSLVEHRRAGHAAGEALCLNNLGAMLLDRGDFPAARVHLDAALALCLRHALHNTRSFVLCNLCQLADKQGDTAAAESHARQALQLATEMGQRAIVSWVRLQLSGQALRRGDLSMARAELADAVDVALTIDRPTLLISGLTTFADLLQAQGEARAGHRVLAVAAAHPGCSAPEREDLLARLARGQAGDDETPWSGPDLAELARRIVVETPNAHAALIAALRR